MANFTVRIELRDASSSDYEELYKKMVLKKFSKYISSDGGKLYNLPNAEYNYSSDTKTTDDVRDLAYIVAKEVNSSPAVLVTKSLERSWQGLDRG
ncbi:TPA: type V toxin-antitoxin system endoribonuclease antitoxin GhoS [Providencia rettgeri]